MSAPLLGFSLHGTCEGTCSNLSDSKGYFIPDSGRHQAQCLPYLTILSNQIGFYPVGGITQLKMRKPMVRSCLLALPNTEKLFGSIAMRIAQMLLKLFFSIESVN